MERKPRENTTKLKPEDLMKPLTFEDFGTENDPCYGKHYSITALECKRCGDSDTCSILSGQTMISETKEQESNHRFMDVEEGQLVDKQNKSLVKLISNKASKKPGEWLSFDKLVPMVRKKFNLTKVDDPQTLQRLIAAAEKANNVQLNKSLTKYRYETE